MRWKKDTGLWVNRAFGAAGGSLACPRRGGAPSGTDPFDLVRERWLNRCANGGNIPPQRLGNGRLICLTNLWGRRLADHRLLEGTTAPALLEAIREAFEDGKEEDLNIIYYSGLADTLNGDTSALTLGGTYGTGLDLLLPQAFYGLLEELPGSFLVILDCDYAGGFLPPNPIVPSSNSVTLLEGMEDEREHSPVEAKVSVLYGVERMRPRLPEEPRPWGYLPGS